MSLINSFINWALNFFKKKPAPITIAKATNKPSPAEKEINAIKEETKVIDKKIEAAEKEIKTIEEKIKTAKKERETVKEEINAIEEKIKAEEKETKTINIKDIINDIVGKLLDNDFKKTSDQRFNALNNLIIRNTVYDKSLVLNNALKPIHDSATADNTNNIKVNDATKTLIAKTLINLNAQVSTIKNKANELLKNDFEKQSGQRFNALNNLIIRNKAYGESLINNALQPLIDSAAADKDKDIEKELIKLNAQVLKDKQESRNEEKNEYKYFIKQLKELENDINPSSYLSSFSHFFKPSNTPAAYLRRIFQSHNAT